MPARKTGLGLEFKAIEIATSERETTTRRRHRAAAVGGSTMTAASSLCGKSKHKHTHTSGLYVGAPRSHAMPSNRIGSTQHARRFDRFDRSARAGPSRIPSWPFSSSTTDRQRTDLRTHLPHTHTHYRRERATMAWQTAPGMIVIVGGFSLVGALYAGVDGLRNWIYHKVSQSGIHRCVCCECVELWGGSFCFGGCTHRRPFLRSAPAARPTVASDGVRRVAGVFGGRRIGRAMHIISSWVSQHPPPILHYTPPHNHSPASSSRTTSTS